MDCVFGGSAALGAMRCLIKRRNLQGPSEQGARVGTAPLVSSVGCASLEVEHQPLALAA